jgi:methionyl-tRNA synthetase
MGSQSKRDILVTIALPYANGQIHLGHMVEAIQADIWVRAQRLQGHQCLFISGNDAHGTAVMLSAEHHEVTPQQWVNQIHQDHSRDFSAFDVDFDNFHSTESEENKLLSESVYQSLLDRGDIVKRVISQAFDAEKQLFLSDRYIKGECPKCGAADQYGDNCEQCGATYSPMELKNPRSVLSDSVPIEKDSEHHFFVLENHRELLEAWVDSGALQSAVANKLKEWFNESLRDWDISRDAPYFGFEIPGSPGKYFYVWLDAPIGYIASTQHYAEKNQLDYHRYWSADSDAELIHFIGKDIIYFHALFWPAMLQGAGYRLPNKVQVHGYLTVNGQKMSKSRGTFITASDFAQYINTDCLRYYYAAKLNNQIEDIDLNFEDFMARVNADLVGKFVNLASRCAGFIHKKFDDQLADQLHDEALFNEFVAAGESIATLYDELQFSRCMREIMKLADRANQYIDQHKPWVLAKDELQLELVQLVCTQGLNLFALLATYLQPVLPKTTAMIEEFLLDDLAWQTLAEPLLATKINKFKPLMQRITAEDIAKLKNETISS